MLDLTTHEVKKRLDYPDSEGEWYEIKYMPVQDYDDLKNDLEAFQVVVIDWGGIVVSGKDFKCTKKNKEKFFNNADDRVQEILLTAMNRTFFAPSGEEFIIKLGKFLSTSRNGVKPNPNLITLTAEPA